MAAGYVEPLDDYLQSASRGYQPEDFLDSVMRANRWTGRFGDRLGTGPLLEIPVNCESYNLVYVPEILSRCGVEVPTTWKDYLSAARKITTQAGPGVRGFGQRGIDVWHTMYTGYATQFWSCGGRDFDESGRCVIASDPGVSATQDFISAVHDAGPVDWTNARWYELAMDFAHGKYGLLVDSDHYVAYFENKEYSDHVGRIGYALPPAGPGGKRLPNLWTWSLVMNARSQNKKAAWDFMEWASTKEFLLRSAFEGNMNPTRKSAWNDVAFINFTRPWDGFYAVSKRLFEELGKVLVTPSVSYLTVASRWTRALLDSYSGKDTVKDALAKAAKDIDGIVRV
jgi:multiple sugar transport system substrate-binding protein